jgi:hypothetical protein
MKMGMQEVKPAGRQVKTDPGVAPPQTGSAKDTDPEGLGISSSATPLGGEPTPVPQETTDGLLSGLMAGENEGYFRRAKEASASNGDAAVAFHGGPRPVSVRNPTPPPEAPVLLRRSVEMDIERVSSRPGVPWGEVFAAEETDDPKQLALRESPPLDPTVPLPAPTAPGTPGTDRVLAFAVAALGAIVIAFLLVHALSSREATTSVPPPVTASAAPAQQAATTTPLATPPPPTTASPPVGFPIPPPPSPESPAPTTPASTSVARPARPMGKTPASRMTGPRASPNTGVAPPAAFPVPKDDVKRSM